MGKNKNIDFFNILFLGESEVGKSSIINRLLGLLELIFIILKILNLKLMKKKMIILKHQLNFWKKRTRKISFFR